MDPKEESSIGVEYRALAETAGLLSESGRAILSVSGERAGDMLHGLVTNDVKSLAVGGGLYAFMLTPKGRPVAAAPSSSSLSSRTDTP